MLTRNRDKERLKAVFVGLLLAVLVSPPTAHAHRSGCHRWHSCPSDHGTYECGDTGHCSQCPDNTYCDGGQPRRAPLSLPPSQQAPSKPQPAPR